MKTKFFKETTLPATLEADAVYFILNENYAETYVTDSNGVAKLVGNSQMITEIAGSGDRQVEYAATIAARDVLVATLDTNTLIFVEDASSDTTVSTGGALYFYDNAGDNSIKVAEFESLDIILEWSNIQNGPTSTPAAIDAAVTDSHTHTNQATLDGIISPGSGSIITTAERAQIGTNADNILDLQNDSHTHANQTQLDLLSEDAENCLTFRGEPVQKWTSNNW